MKLTSTSHGNLAVNSDAVVEVAPFVRAESDFQRVGETWDKSILEMKRPKREKKNKKKGETSHRISESTADCPTRPDILFRSAS